MFLTLIIGKESNLSKFLYSNIPNSILISSREVIENINILNKYKSTKINIIFNNFQPSIHLNNYKNTSSYITNAILSTSKILDYFTSSNINKIIYTSSSSVYGNNILCKESDELKPMNLHSSLKVSNEKLVESYCLYNNIDFTITRIFNMYGGNDNFSVISKIINAYKNKKILNIVNNGNAIRDFIHIHDVVEIYIKLLEKNDIKLLNIGTGIGNSIKSILDFLNKNNIYLSINTVFKDELKISTADNRLLLKIFSKEFIRVEDYLKEKLDI